MNMKEYNIIYNFIKNRKYNCKFKLIFFSSEDFCFSLNKSVNSCSPTLTFYEQLQPKINCDAANFEYLYSV